MEYVSHQPRTAVQQQHSSRSVFTRVHCRLHNECCEAIYPVSSEVERCVFAASLGIETGLALMNNSGSLQGLEHNPIPPGIAVPLSSSLDPHPAALLESVLADLVCLVLLRFVIFVGCKEVLPLLPRDLRDRS